MMSNVKKKDVPLISISLVAILFIAAALSLFPQQSADAANAIYTFVTRTLGSAVQVRQYSSWRRKTGIQHALLAVYVYLCRFRFFYALLGGC